MEILIAWISGKRRLCLLVCNLSEILCSGAAMSPGHSKFSMLHAISRRAWYTKSYDYFTFLTRNQRVLV